MVEDSRVDSKREAPALDIVLVGAGDRARGWLETVTRSPRLRLVATVSRSGAAVASHVPVYRRVPDAVDAHPGAGFALALPPRSGLDAALALEEAGVAGVVEAPLHDSLCELDRTVGGEELVRVAHGWTTLPGRRVVDKLMRRLGSGRLTVEIAGLPESEQGDVGEALVHGLALVRSLVSGPAVTGARLRRGELSVELESAGAGGGWAVEMRLRPRGSRLRRQDRGGVGSGHLDVRARSRDRHARGHGAGSDSRGTERLLREPWRSWLPEVAIRWRMRWAFFDFGARSKVGWNSDCRRAGVCCASRRRSPTAVRPIFSGAWVCAASCRAATTRRPACSIPPCRRSPSSCGRFAPA